MKNAKRIVTVLLCALVIFSMTACGSLLELGRAVNAWRDGQEITTGVPDSEYETEKTGEKETTETEAQEETTKAPSSPVYTAHISDANKELVPEYKHYDASEFNEKCGQLKKLAADGKENEALELYDELYEELEYIDAMNTVIYIRSREDVNNEKDEEEMEYMDELFTDCNDRFLVACHELSVSSFADDFSEHVGDDDIIKEYEEYGEMTDREKELKKRETELTNEYSKAADGAMDYAYEYNGTTYKLGDFYDAGSTSLENIQPEDYYLILAACLKQFNEDVGDIFTELVRIRTEIAQLNGYGNYADYADAEIYMRDYSAADLQKFESMVKSIGNPGSDLASYFYYSLAGMEGLSIDEYLEKVGSVLRGISPYADSAFKFFRENKLYSLGNEDSRYDAGFTASIMSPSDTGFIFYKLSDTTYDIDTMVHEMGHFTESFMNGNNIMKTTSYDVAEIHSTGLELLACSMFDSALSEDEAGLLMGTVLSNARSTVVSGCSYDEWQRYVYTHPDMTLDEINAKFREINSEYGHSNEEYYGYQWCLVTHNFDSPMYYVSYAVSAIMALQIWEESCQDFGKAARMWETIIDAGAYAPLAEATKKAGLTPFSDENMSRNILNDVDLTIQQLFYSAYLGGF